MAHDINEQFKVPLLRRLFFRFNGPGRVKKSRAKKRAQLSISEEESKVTFDEQFDAQGSFAVNWNDAQQHFSEHGWYFCEPFLSEAFYKEVVRDWPERLYLNPPKKVTKWYNTGFFWMRDRLNPRYLKEHPGIEALIQSLGSITFTNAITRLTGAPMEFIEFHVTDSNDGAEVPMHLDGLLNIENGDKAIGIAIFMDGAGGPRSGGLCVSSSSEWDDMLFEPHNLKNTALIYSKKLHHGFLPIEKGKFRHSINTQYWPTGSIEANQPSA